MDLRRDPGQAPNQNVPLNSRTRKNSKKEEGVWGTPSPALLSSLAKMPIRPSSAPGHPYLQEEPVLNPASPMARLLAVPPRPGEILWIGVRPDRRQPMLPLAEAAMAPDTGLAGDRYSSRTSRSRQVTLIGAENLSSIASYLGRQAVDPALLRRNILVRGINLLTLKGQRIRLGSAILEVTGECHPCSRMEEVLGLGGYNAMRGQGGITARVVTAGQAALGSVVESVAAEDQSMIVAG
jgi:MOSC domain-containing protein YiiM